MEEMYGSERTKMENGRGEGGVVGEDREGKGGLTVCDNT